MIYAVASIYTAVYPSLGDPTKLERTYTPNESLTYDLNLDIPSQKEHISAKIHWLVKDSTPSGGTVSLSVSDAIGRDANKATPMPAVADQTWPFEKNGMSREANMSGDGFPYALLGFASYLPGRLSTGQRFKLEWTSKGATMKVTGTGSFAGIKEIDGAKAAEIKSDFHIVPSAGGPAGGVEMEDSSYIDPSNGALIEAEGVFRVGKDKALYSLKKESASD